LISDRLNAALGGVIVGAIEGGVRVRVDDVDRRYRDAIKAGATPVGAPRAGARVGERVAMLRDGVGAMVEIVSGGPDTLG
jgi:hypothetical protein